MVCDRSREQLSAYLDGELDESSRREVAAHVAACRDCSKVIDDMRGLRASLAAGARMRASAGLGDRVRMALQKETVAPAAPVRPRLKTSSWQQAAAVILVSLASASGGWMAAMRTARVDRIERDVVTAHMRSLAQGMPMQVASNDTHNVKPWFAGRIDFSPRVNNLAATGFDLIGGRLDFVDGRRVSVVIYKRRLHWIDVYAWPAGQAASPPKAASSTGYNIVSWTRDGIAYWAVSDLNLAELQELPALM